VSEAMCERCRRIIGELDDEFTSWESNGDVDENGLIIATCGGCLTGQEVQAIDDDYMDGLPEEPEEGLGT